MATTVNWVTGVISILRADMTLLQTTPTEIRELSTNAFRVELRGLEDDIDGRPWPRTHDHNEDVSVGGVSLADVLLILDPYTITFEDGQYAVYLQGTNNNILEKTNKNQVSVNPSNSAGLVNSAAIEFSSFAGGVNVDVNSGFSGTIYPTGTPQQRVNNLADALLIQAYRGFTDFYVKGDLTIDSGGDYRFLVFIGDSVTKTIFTISSNAQVEGCEFYDATIDGVLDGNCVISQCIIENLDYIYGVIDRCILNGGRIALGGSETAYITDCKSGVNFPVIDCGGSGQDVVIQNYNGKIKITNKTGENDVVDITLNAGEVYIDSSVTAGKITISGIGELTNKSTGTAVVESSALISSYLIATVTWDTIYLSDDGEPGTVYPLGTAGFPINNVADALLVAAREKLRIFNLRGSYLFPVNGIKGAVVKSDGASLCDMDLNSQFLDQIVFKNITLIGTVGSGFFDAHGCRIDSVKSLAGNFLDCEIIGSISVSQTLWVNMSRCVGQNDIPITIDMQGSGKITITNTPLAVNVINMTDPTAVFIKHGVGDVTFDSSSTAGSVHVAGEAALIIDGATGLSYLDNTTRRMVWLHDEDAYEGI